MERPARNLQKGHIVCMILCALFALLSLALYWVTHSSDVFPSISPVIGGVRANIEPVLLLFSAAYVLSVFLMGVFRKSRPALIVLGTIGCLIALCYFIPAGGMKTKLIADAFLKKGGKGVALCFECLRRIFFVLVHGLLIAAVVSGSRRKLARMESLALHAALVFIVSSLMLSLFASPEAVPAMEFVGLRYWGNFFEALIKSPLFAFSKFDISAAAVFPLCEGAALLLVYSVLHAINAAPKARSAAKPVPAAKARPAAKPRPAVRTVARGNDFEQLQHLAELRRQGMISDAEFYRRKRQLLED